MKIMFLYSGGCLSHDTVFQDLKAVLEEEGVPEDIEVIKVRTDEEAKRLKFIGSPTIRIDGADIEQGVEKRTDYGLKCRHYPQPMGDLIGWQRG